MNTKPSCKINYAIFKSNIYEYAWEINNDNDHSKNGFKKSFNSFEYLCMLSV